MKHKISDVVLDVPNYTLSFLLFPKFSKVRFSLRLTVHVLASESPHMSIDILSSTLKKRNQKGQIFSDMERQFEEIIRRISTGRDRWLIEALDQIVETMSSE